MNDNKRQEDVETTPSAPSLGGLSPGTLVDERFAVEALAGRGGMGQVYRARDEQTGQRVALKLLHGTPAQDALYRFHREATLLSSLRHPGLVAHVAHGATEQGQSYLVMEWLEGEELARRLARQPLSIAESLALVRRVAEALAHAHQRGIVHRDLKPSNLFLRGGRAEDVVILDFGLARHAHSTRMGVTRSHTVVGTPGYMAPEQASSQPEIPPAADIFSLGCVLYECLTGRPPFEAPHFAASLAKILFAEPVPLRALRPELSGAWETLVTRMLAKVPGQRPADATELLAALESLALEQPPSGVPERPRMPSFTGAERQLVSVLLMSPRVDSSRPESSGEASPHEILRALLVPRGGRVERLADGSWVATLVPGRGTATDQAALAARCALGVKERWPRASVALVTGLGVLDAHLPVGDAMDKAGQLLRRMEREPSSSVVMDEVTAGLLGPGFGLTPSGSGSFLLRDEHGGADTSRPLLGKPTPCVGREQELALLESCFATCREESSARALLVTAAAGVGKSRLRHEFLRRVEHAFHPPRVLLARGDAMHKGASYGLLGQALREWCGVVEGESLESRRARLSQHVARHVPEAQAREVAEFLGELCAVPFPDEDRPRLRAARQEPQLMSVQLGRALVTLLDAECARTPVLLVLEDLHWSDALTVTLVDRLLRELSERPFLVLALARPEVKHLYPSLWGRMLQELSLNGLSRKACARLVREVLGADVPESEVRRTVEHSDGNALFLEELIRMVAEGRGDKAPETVLAVLQARLLRMEPGVRHTLLVASLFGRAFWPGGVCELLGRAPGDAEVKTHLRLLVEEEVIESVPDSRFSSEPEYRFRHALVRDAAYGLLAETHRTPGHQLAGAWLERMGEPDAEEIATHYQLGQRAERAASFYIQAVERLFERGDRQGTMRCVEAAVACGVSGEALPRLRALEALAAFWMDHAPRGMELGGPVLDALVPGERIWCWLLSGLALGLAMEGHAEASWRLTSRLLSTEPEADAVNAYLEALAQLGATFYWAGEREQLARLVERAREVSEPFMDRPTSARASLGMLESQRIILEEKPWSSLLKAEAAQRDFEELGVERWAALFRASVGLHWLELGESLTAVRLLRESWAWGQRTGHPFVSMMAHFYLMQALTFSPLPEHRREAQERARAVDAGGTFFSVNHGLLAMLAARALNVLGDAREAEALARGACGVLKPFPSVLGFACALLSTSLLTQGRMDEARREAEAGVRWMESRGMSVYSVPTYLALVEVCLAQGDAEATEAVLRKAMARVRERASDIPDAVRREHFLTHVPENARLLAIAQERWGDLYE
ncbi:serine/threonine-protein kinase [Melittangium boletus]|uniref:non-specific serine/threonine protein kinase n=1 Tax=Melittangium boletus DSM 14713 TaxID=1294270 RepID=A0A250IM28_9BACT|nr:serine/threonine-protein kinase [Melittangium boletus]ATB32272.1 serine/threonine protein kinase [Melittangium boletus DSM 14713]